VFHEGAAREAQRNWVASTSEASWWTVCPVQSEMDNEMKRDDAQLASPGILSDSDAGEDAL
jgi:hypothetical protein